MCCVKYGNFSVKILHVIPKVLGCCFVTKKFDFLDFGVREGDKMAENISGLEGSKAKRLEGLPPSVKDVNVFNVLNVLGATAFCPTVSL